MFKEDFPSSLYGSPEPESDQEAIDQAIEDHEANQPGPPPTPEEIEEVVDETSGQTYKDIDARRKADQAADDARLAQEGLKDIHPKPDQL